MVDIVVLSGIQDVLLYTCIYQHRKYIMAKKYTKEVLEPIVAKSYSVAQVVKAFNLKMTGGNQSNMKKRIIEAGLDFSHFNGQGWNKGERSTKGTNKYPIEDYLSNKRYISSHKLKLRLFKEGLKKDICEVCNIAEWHGNKLPLHLDHINCNHEDNNLENLQILCPNCHSVKTRNDAKTRASLGE